MATHNAAFVTEPVEPTTRALVPVEPTTTALVPAEPTSRALVPVGPAPVTTGPAPRSNQPVHSTVIPPHATTGPGATIVPAEPVVYASAPVTVLMLQKRKPTRGFIIGILTSIAFIFWLIAMTTPLAMTDTVTTNTTGANTTEVGRLRVDPWHSCSRLTDESVAFCRPMGHPDEPCTESRDSFRVEQAFLLLTGIFLLALLACAALDFSHKLYVNTPDLPFGLGSHGWMIFFAFVTALVSCVAFAVGFAIPRANPCNNGSLYERDNFDWGPSPVFSLLIFITAVAIVIAAIVLRENGSVKSRNEIAHPHQPMTVRPTEPMAP